MNERALAEAAAWRVRLAEAGLDGSPEHLAWLASNDAQDGLLSPASQGGHEGADSQGDLGAPDVNHRAAAWAHIQSQWTLLGEQAAAPEVVELRCQALAHAHEASCGRWVRSKRFASAHSLSLVASVLLVALAAVFVWVRQPDVYSTHAGERRVVTLSDGSQMALDSRSEVRVRYTAHARELTLLRGQARFDVAHDVERPFSVAAGAHKVIALGTAFNMDLFRSNLLVTLIEGHVVVAPLANVKLTPIDLTVGEQVTFAPRVEPRVARVNVGQATAWENGEVVFENEPLETVVARINRYARNTVTLGDPETAGLRISGVFHTGDVAGFVSTLEAYLPVRADQQGDGSTVLVHR